MNVRGQMSKGGGERERERKGEKRQTRDNYRAPDSEGHLFLRP